jgi:hypothetical protein
VVLVLVLLVLSVLSVSAGCVDVRVRAAKKISSVPRLVSCTGNSDALFYKVLFSLQQLLLQHQTLENQYLGQSRSVLHNFTFDSRVWVRIIIVGMKQYNKFNR